MHDTQRCLHDAPLQTSSAVEAPSGVHLCACPLSRALAAQVLKTHVIGAPVLSTELQEGQSVTPLSEVALKVSLANGVTFSTADGASSAAVTKADIKACNSVVHLIDSVLLPGNLAEEMGADVPSAVPINAPAAPVTGTADVRSPEQVASAAVATTGALIAAAIGVALMAW
jgi:hypothetical protein